MGRHKTQLMAWKRTRNVKDKPKLNLNLRQNSLRGTVQRSQDLYKGVPTLARLCSRKKMQHKVFSRSYCYFWCKSEDINHENLRLVPTMPSYETSVNPPENSIKFFHLLLRKSFSIKWARWDQPKSLEPENPENNVYTPALEFLC